jgi:polyhydroxyalkanoate synthesis regulator phasin
VNQKAVEAFELLIRRIERIESDIIALQSIKVGTQSEMEDLRESVDGLKENMKDIRIDINKKK